MNNIEKGNLVIAKYMGGEYRTTYNGVENASEELFYLPGDDITYPRRDFVRDIPYHSDWNYLMPVVEKISKQGYDILINILSIMSINRTNTRIVSKDFLQDMMEEKSIPIDSVWSCVVRWIECYHK
jgi:hypothetical protein